MFIGQIGINSYFHNMFANQKGIGISHMQSHTVPILKDRLEIGSQYQQNKEIGLYRPGGNQMQVLPSVSCFCRLKQGHRIIIRSDDYAMPLPVF